MATIIRTTIPCIGVDMPVPPPSLEIPGLGAIQQARAALNNLTDPSEMLMQMQNQLAVALAPIRRFIEMLEAIMALQGCVTAIPTAITSLSPKPIVNCLKNLVKAIGVLTNYIPPKAWVRTAMDVASWSIDVIDELIGLFEDMDERITQYTQLWDEALALGDLELQASMQCSVSEVKALTLNMFEILMIIKPLNDVLIDVFVRITNAKILEDAAEKYKKVNSNLPGMKQAIIDGSPLPLPDDLTAALIQSIQEKADSQHSIIPLPPLGALFQGMNEMRNAVVIIYNFIAPWVGLDPNKTTRETPEFNNW
jgi:hypothetical protein